MTEDSQEYLQDLYRTNANKPALSDLNALRVAIESMIRLHESISGAPFVRQNASGFTILPDATSSHMGRHGSVVFVSDAERDALRNA